MIPALVGALRAADPQITPEEIADVLWLAHRLPGGQPDSTTGDRPDRPEDAGETAGESPAVDRDPGGRDSRRDPAGAGTAPRAGRPVNLELRLPPRRLLLDREPGVRIGSPAVPALPATLGLARALRLLQRQLPSRTEASVDERATAELAADSDLWLPVLRPIRDRWLDLALVVDESASMVIWQRTIAELLRLLRGSGIFGDVRVWRMDSDRGGPGGVPLRGEGPDGAGGRDPRELIDPSGRRIVLVVSDCVGGGWGDGRVGRALEVWSSAGPVAVVQPLPQRMWDDCAPHFVPVRLRATAPVSPNRRLAVRPRVDLGIPAEAVAVGTAVPVLELDARWLRGWASLVTGTAGGWISGTAIFLADLRGQARRVRAGPPGQPSELLGRFRASASADANRLAVYLAGAPLSLPVMRLVQNVMLPASRPAHLAEVFLSGLLRRVSPADRDLPPDEVEYDFLPTVREHLLRRLPKPDALLVLRRVSAFVSERLGTPLDFKAMITDPDAVANLPDLGRPFAEVAARVLSNLGGRYAAAGERLGRRAELAGARRRPDNQQESGHTRIKTTTSVEGEIGVTGPSVRAVAVHERRHGDQPAVWGRSIPLRNPHFTGRRRLLEDLRATLVQSSDSGALLLHAVHGLGGVGKTQLAAEYAYQYASEYDLVWWVPAEDPALVRASLTELSHAMGLAESVDAAQTVAVVQEALRMRRPYDRWLIVFDNADQPEDLRPYLPHASGHVLITSRNQAWADVAATLEVDVFAREESVALLRRRGRGISDQDAQRLADALGDLPLALEQAAAWQAETGMSVAEYLRLLETRLDQLLREKAPAGYSTPVAAAWGLAFERLREQSPGAVQFLEVCAYLGSEPISLEMLWAGRRAELPSPLDRVMRDEIAVRRMVRDIGRYALAKVDQNTIQVHRLVQAVLRSSLPPGRQAETRATAQRVLAVSNPGEPDKTQNWERHAQLSPHVIPSGAIDSDDDEVRRVALDQIRYRYMRGDYESSRDLGEAVVASWRRQWGPDEELTLIATRHLAIALRELGQLIRAAELNEDTLERMRRVFGDDHEHTINTANSFGADLRNRGDFTGALDLDRANFELCRETFGPDDPLTLRCGNNYALDMRLMGDYTGARALGTELQERRRLVLGEGHPHVLNGYCNLVRDLYGAGEYAEALRQQEEVLPAYRARLGSNNNEVLLGDRNVAIALRKLGEYQRARRLAEENYRAYRHRFGPEHENTLAATVSLGNTLRVVGDLSEARRLGESALAGYRVTFAPEHPLTLACAVDLAIVLRQLGEVAEARTMDEWALSALTSALGADHPWTLCSLGNLASDHAAAGDAARAAEISQQAVERSRLVRGDTHPYTLTAEANLALDLRATGAEERAAGLFSAVLRGYAETLGEDHPETIAVAARRRADADIEPPPT